MNDDGATIVPVQELSNEEACWITKVGLDGVAVQAKTIHHWHWVWVNGAWTDEMECGSCLKRKPCFRPKHASAASHYFPTFEEREARAT